MKAFTYDRYGPPEVLELREIEIPPLADDDVLVRVHATSINPADWHAMTGVPYIARLSFGLRRPKAERLGTDFAGTVEAVGKDVTRFRAGDAVFGGRTGAFAEYVVVPQDRAIVPKPPNVTFEQAASVAIAALTALQGLRDKGKLEAGHKVLVNGASGGVGTFAVQIAKALGAEVTAVCSTRNVELVRSLGADRVIDYTQDDFTRTGQRYDVLLDIAGNRSWSECKRVLSDGAHLVVVGGPKANRWIGPIGHLIRMKLASLFDSRKLVVFIAKVNKADLEVMCELFESGKVTPAVERRYELNELPEAMAYLGTGHAKAKLVVAV
jgi:NADPH:quinone reductase-like Zn-dependent oxidoreductase